MAKRQPSNRSPYAQQQKPVQAPPPQAGMHQATSAELPAELPTEVPSLDPRFSQTSVSPMQPMQQSGISEVQLSVDGGSAEKSGAEVELTPPPSPGPVITSEQAQKIQASYDELIQKLRMEPDAQFKGNLCRQFAIQHGLLFQGFSPVTHVPMFVYVG